MSTLHSLRLNGGNHIPMIGYGTGTAWYKPAGNGISINEELIESLKTAIKLGYHHLDGSEVYNTERELGKAISESGVLRENLFITTKVIFNIADIPKAINQSLENLQLDYVDLYLIHSPYFAQSDEDLQKAWAAMEQVKLTGKAKSIGVSNYRQQDLEATLKTAKIVPAVNQIEYHPYLQHTSLLQFQKEKNIAVAAYGPLSPITRAKGGSVDHVIEQLAQKYQVSDAEVLLRFCLDQGIIALTTSRSVQRMSEYLRCLTFKLTPEEVWTISERGEKTHFRGFWAAKFAEDDRS